MKTLNVLLILAPLIFTTGCVLQAQLKPAEANASEGDTNLGSSQSTFTAIFKANNTHLVGLYDENTTAATVSGVCKPGDVIVLDGYAVGLTTANTVFCPESGTWSTGFDLNVNPKSSSYGTNSLIASTRGSSTSTALIHLTYSPTTFPTADSWADIYTDGPKQFVVLYVGGANSSSLNSRISNIGLTQKKQYQYRLEIYRGGSVLLNLGSVDSLSAAKEITTPYTWQNGDTVKVTAFDSSGDGPTDSYNLGGSQPAVM